MSSVKTGTSGVGRSLLLVLLGAVSWPAALLGPSFLPIPYQFSSRTLQTLLVLLFVDLVCVIQSVGLENSACQLGRSVLNGLRAFCVGCAIDLFLVVCAWAFLVATEGNPSGREITAAWLPFLTLAPVVGALVGGLPVLILQRHASHRNMWLLFSTLSMAAAVAPLAVLQFSDLFGFRLVMSVMFCLAEAITAATLVLWLREDDPKGPRLATEAIARVPAETNPPMEAAKQPVEGRTRLSKKRNTGLLRNAAAMSMLAVVLSVATLMGAGITISNRKPMLTVTGHTGYVTHVAFSPDGTRVATASADGTAKIWDASTGQELLNLIGHTDTVYSIVFNSNGTRLVTASADKTARVWDATTGKELLTVTGPDWLLSVALSPDAKRLAATSHDGTIEVWDATTGTNVLAFNTLQGQHWGIAFSPDGTRLATASAAGTTSVWDAATGKELLEVSAQTYSAHDVAFSSDGQRLATANENEAQILDATTGKTLLTLVDLNGQGAVASGLAFSPDGKRLATADGVAKVWDATTGREMLILDDGTKTILVIAFSPDGKHLATASSDGTAKVWDMRPLAFPKLPPMWASTPASAIKTGGPTQPVSFSTLPPTAAMGSAAPVTLTPAPVTPPAIGAAEAVEHLLIRPGAPVFKLAFSPDGHLLAGTAEDTLRIWDAKTGVDLHQGSPIGLSGWGVAFSPNSRLLATGTSDNSVDVIDVATGSILRVLRGHTTQVYAVAFSPDGRLLASGDASGIIRMWDPETGLEARVLKGHTDWVNDLAFGPVGHLLASASSDGTVALWDPTTGTQLSILSGHKGPGNAYDPMITVAFSSDGRLLATGGHDQTVRIWDVASRTLLRELSGHGDVVKSVAFNPAGQLVASGSSDRTVRLWDYETGTSLQLLAEHTDSVSGVAFSPDGHTLASASLDGTVILWDVHQ